MTADEVTTESVGRRRYVLLLVVAGIAIVGFVARLWVIRHAIAEMNSDEFYTGLQARAIVEGDRPIIFRGIGYTAVIDSYLLAPVVWLFGAPITLLKLFNAPWWALTAIIAALTLRAVTPGSGAAAGADDDTVDPGDVHAPDDARSGSRTSPFVVAALIWVTPGALLVLSTRSYEAYGLLFLGIAATQYLTVRSVATAGTAPRWSWALGFVAGFTFFLHPMTLAATIPMLTVAALRARREVRTFWIPTVVGGIIANLGFIAWNVKNSWLSLAVPPALDSYTDRLPRFFTGLLPRALGLMDTAGGWTLGALSVVLYLVILACAVVGVVDLLRRGWLGCAVAVPAIAVWPFLAVLTATWYVDDGRYAVVGFTHLVILVVNGACVVGQRLPSPRFATSANLVPVALALVWIVIGGVFWLRANAGPAVDDPNARMRAVTELLEASGIEYAAGNYWHVQPVEYLSEGDIHVAVAGHPWGAYLDWRPELPWGVLFPPRQPEVAAQPNDEVAYIFDAADEQVGTLRMEPEAYTRHQIGSSIVYIPNR